MLSMMPFLTPGLRSGLYFAPMERRNAGVTASEQIKRSSRASSAPASLIADKATGERNFMSFSLLVDALKLSPRAILYLGMLRLQFISSRYHSTVAKAALPPRYLP